MPGPDAAAYSPLGLLAEPVLTAKRWEAAAGLCLHPGGLRPGTCRKTVRIRLRDFTFFLSIVPFGEGNGNPLQCSCLENPVDRGAWRAAVYGVTGPWGQEGSHDFVGGGGRRDGLWGAGQRCAAEGSVPTAPHQVWRDVPIAGRTTRVLR